MQTAAIRQIAVLKVEFANLRVVDGCTKRKMKGSDLIDRCAGMLLLTNDYSR